MRSNAPDPWSPQPEESFLKRIGITGKAPTFQRGRLLTIVTRIQLPLGILLFILPLCIAAIPDGSYFCRIVMVDGWPDLGAYMLALGVAVVVSSFRVPRKAMSTLWAFCAAVALFSTSCFLWIIGNFLQWEPTELSLARMLLLYITIFVLSLLALTFLIELIVQSIRAWRVVKIYPKKDQVVKGWYRFIGGMGHLVSLGIITVSVSAPLFIVSSGFGPGPVPWITIKDMVLLALFICTLPALFSLAVFLVALGLRRRESWAWMVWILGHCALAGYAVYVLLQLDRDYLRGSFSPDDLRTVVLHSATLVYAGFILFVICEKEGHLFPQWWERVLCYKCGSSFRMRIGKCTICNGQLHLERTSMPYLDCHHCGAENVLAPVTCQSCLAVSNTAEK